MGAAQKQESRPNKAKKQKSPPSTESNQDPLNHKVIVLLHHILLLGQLHYLGLILVSTYLEILVVCTCIHILFNILLHMQIMECHNDR